jgi:pSer/pThr/pTyr-binding forkhead associated (FHA) protein
MDVSRRHCSITPVQGGYLLRDESANGTLVNGSRVSGTYLLGHGDVVRVAEDDLRFEVDGAPDPAPATAAASTAVLDVSRLRAEYSSAKTAEHPGTPLVANLEIVRGPFAGASFSLDRPVCSIGRSAESDVRIRDESISSNHATLLRKGASWFVVDLRSANGTFVDGSRIAGERELTSGSRLKLGRVELMFRALDGGSDNAMPTRRTRWWLFEWLAPMFSRKTEAAPEDAQ